MRSWTWIWAVGVFAALMVAGCSGKTQEAPLLGEWAGVAEDGSEATIKFMRGNLFVAGVGEDSLSGRYEVSFETEPGQLDLLIENTEPILTIVEIEGEDKIRIQATEPGAARPTTFTPEATVYSRVRR
ncbi:MAG: hypothetical protein HY319_30040 [Armatimonadetes bacterium]|nr:hypothetical protein [Armatimonadota bacterium]